MKTPLYSLRNIIKTRNRDSGYSLHIPALDIYPGERIVFMGPSGCGKSTALDLLGLSLAPDTEHHSSFLFRPEGGVLNIVDLWRKKQREALARLRLVHLNYVIQTGGLLPFLSVAENMALSAQARGLSGTTALVQDIAERLGIAALLQERPASLSIGERQRVAIGRALVGSPRVILADEPTAALDPLNAREVMNLLTQAAAALNEVTLIVVSHDRTLFDDRQFVILETTVLRDDNGATRAQLAPRASDRDVAIFEPAVPHTAQETGVATHADPSEKSMSPQADTTPEVIVVKITDDTLTGTLFENAPPGENMSEKQADDKKPSEKSTPETTTPEVQS